jgi:hypothetical protein
MRGRPGRDFHFQKSLNPLYCIRFLQSLTARHAVLAAENLFLRKQLAFYQEHQIGPRRLTATARFSLLFWSRFCDWRNALVIVKPETLIGWHRKGFKLFWKWKSRPGRPRIPVRLRHLIAEMVRENPSWGQARIANELSLKLGIQVSPPRYEPTGRARFHPISQGQGRNPGRLSFTIMPKRSSPVISWSPSPPAFVFSMYCC